jgi:hypothetical protein
MLGSMRSALNAKYRAMGAVGPTNIPGLQLWVDATDISTLWQDKAKTSQVSANGQMVLCWEDKSGQGNDLTADSNGPLYATSGINSNGSLEFINNGLNNEGFLLSQPNTVFVLLNSTVSDNTGSIVFDNYNNDRCILLRNQSSSWQIGTAPTNVISSTSGAFGLQVMTVCFNGVNSYLRESGNEIINGNAGINGFIGIRIGGLRVSLSASIRANFDFIGQMSEILIYNKVLSSKELTSVEAYLASKGGITL